MLRAYFMIVTLLAISTSAAVQPYFPLGYHDLDTTPDWRISLPELLRAIQFYNSGGYYCAWGTSTEDGFVPGCLESEGEEDEGQDPWLENFLFCCPHSLDYVDPTWQITMPELLRAIQFYNIGGYHIVIGSEDGFAPGLEPDDSGAFPWRELDASPGHLRQMEICDLNGDGMPDVYINSDTQGLSWWENKGNGGFARHVIHEPIADTALIDMDEDGDLDILGSHDPELGTVWWENDGSGGYAQRLLAGTDVRPGLVADFNGDGRPDVVIPYGSAHLDRGTWWRKDGPLTFTRVDFRLAWSSDEVESWRFTAASDFNADGCAELLGVCAVGESFDMLFSCEFANETELLCREWLPLSTNSIIHAPPADFDADGDLDVVVTLEHFDDQYWQLCPWELCANCAWDEMLLYENDGSGSFTVSRLLVRRVRTPDAFHPVQMADLNADGNLDILICAHRLWEPTGRSLGWWERCPSGAWVMRYIGSVWNGVPSPVVADFNGDGLPDVVGVNASGALGWWENRLGQ